MAQPAQDEPQEQRLLPCFFFTMADTMIDTNITATTAATIMLAKFIFSAPFESFFSRASHRDFFAAADKPARAALQQPQRSTQ